MRSFLSLSVAALMALATSGTEAASLASCDLESLVPLLVDARNDACFASSGVMFPPNKAPTAAQWARTCSVKACSTLYADLLTAAPSECAIGQFAVHADIVNAYKTACGLPITTEEVSSASQDGGPQTMSTASHSEDRTVGPGSLAIDNDVSAQTLEETTAPAPTPSKTMRSNSTNTVISLTSSAPSLVTSSSVMATLVGSTAMALVVTFVL